MSGSGKKDPLSEFYELQVFDGVAEATGNRLDQPGVRGRQSVCRSLTALGAKWRRFGDGYYYLASEAWPAESEKCDLKRAWACVG